MLKTRIIPVLLCRGRELVKGERFVNDRVVGNAMQACRVHNMRGVDELVLLEVGGGLIDVTTVSLLASECFMPLAVGGGVRTIEDMHQLFLAGADKVVLGGVAYFNQQLVTAASHKFGAQSVTVTVNVHGLGIECRGRRLHVDPVWWVQELQRLGAGEIILQNVERDGMMKGYDLEMLNLVASSVSIPVVASSGCGSYADMAAALDAGAHAVAAGAMFQFTDQTPQGAAKFLAERGYPTRIAA